MPTDTSAKGRKSVSRSRATLGRLDLLQQSGQLERLMRSGVRHCEGLAVLDAHAAGQMEPVSARRIGPHLVFGRLWQESGLPEVLRTLLKGRRYGFDVERALYLTVLHRLFASGSDRAADRWRENYLIGEREIPEDLQATTDSNGGDRPDSLILGLASREFPYERLTPGISRSLPEISLT